MAATQDGLQPVVFVGPSCPAGEIRSILPGAFILPPVRRGDLYRLRMLNFSVFLVLDGVFANTLAVSPREVVDVIGDGACVIGASSMGALRAADCRPAGALGHGRIYRLYRRHVLGSEDEVAVTFLPQRPWPALTQALVNMRIALRRARRAGIMNAAQAAALENAAASLPYGTRTWDAAAALCAVGIDPAQREFLSACDVKREDARSCCHWLSERLARGEIRAAPRKNLSAPVGRMMQPREHGPDPRDGDAPANLREPFAAWLALSGEGDPAAAAGDLETPSAAVAALLMRFIAFRRARELARKARIRPAVSELAHAGNQIAIVHGHADWSALIAAWSDNPDAARRLLAYRRDRAAISMLLREVLLAPVAPPVWERRRR